MLIISYEIVIIKVMSDEAIRVNQYCKCNIKLKTVFKRVPLKNRIVNNFKEI